VPQTDEQLTLRARDGDLAAFELLVERYHRRALGLARTVVRDPEDAREVAQDAFVKAFQSVRRLRDAEAFGPWLLQTVHRLALNRARANRVRQERRASLDPEAASALDPDPTSSPHRAYVQSEARDAVTAAIRSLPQTYAAVAWLRFADEMKVAEIARTLGLSRAATESRLRRATAMLREALSEHYPELTSGESQDEMPLDSEADLQAVGRRA